MKLVITWECTTTLWMEVDHTLTAGDIRTDLESSVINVPISNRATVDNLLELSLVIQTIAATDSWDIIIILIIGQIVRFDFFSNTMFPKTGEDAWKLDQVSDYIF